MQIPLSHRREEDQGETVAQVPITAKEGVEAVTFGAAFLALGRALFTL